jgi:adenosine deaminase
LKEKELKQLLDSGVRATINSDDPAYFNGYMTENFVAVHDAIDLSKDELVQLSRNAFNVTWLPEEDRKAYVDALDEYAAGS